MVALAQYIAMVGALYYYQITWFGGAYVSNMQMILVNW